MSSDNVTRKVLVVDDSALLGLVLREVIESIPGFEVCGVAYDGDEALRLVHELDPDIVTLDIEMPRVDGLSTLGYIMSEAPRPVIMVSGATTQGSVDVTIRALELGALDFIRKPRGNSVEEWQQVAGRLGRALNACNQMNVKGVPVLARPRLSGETARKSVIERPTVAVAIACSTGGPRALAEVVPALGDEMQAAVLIAQHMPPGFTAGLARRLNALSGLNVVEASDAERLLPGHVYLAPGGRHMYVAKGSKDIDIRLSDEASLHGVKPAADILFTSVAEVFGANSVGVVLTGMGKDGSIGLGAIRRRGGGAVVQNKATSVIYGMPQQALLEAGADAEVPLSEVGSAVRALVSARLKGASQ